MAITVQTTFKDIQLDSAYLRLTRLELRKDEGRLTAEFQMHKDYKKGGNLEYVSIECDYNPDQDPRQTVFEALKKNYQNPVDC